MAEEDAAQGAGASRAPGQGHGPVVDAAMALFAARGWAATSRRDVRPRARREGTRLFERTFIAVMASTPRGWGAGAPSMSWYEVGSPTVRFGFTKE